MALQSASAPSPSATPKAISPTSNSAPRGHARAGPASPADGRFGGADQGRAATSSATAPSGNATSAKCTAGGSPASDAK
jgi:hypothetical protein